MKRLLSILVLLAFLVSSCTPTWHGSIYGGKHNKKKAPRASGKMGNW